MSQITILFLYITAAAAFAMSRMAGRSGREPVLRFSAFLLSIAGLFIHARSLFDTVTLGDGINLSLLSAISLIGLQLALIGIVAALNPSLRGLAAALLVLAAPSAFATGSGVLPEPGPGLTWQIKSHVFTSMFAYGLLTAGAIIAVYTLIQDNRLRRGRLSTVNQFFAPLETAEKLLYGVTAAGFGVLALSVVSGITFVEDLFAQHLVHKTALSLLALLLFGVLLAGRHFAGWRGKRAVYLYLIGFALLGLAYFGSRIVLEEILHQSWGA